MANRIKFEFTDNIRKTEEELLALVASSFPHLTPIDCYITRIIVFSYSNNLAKLTNKETTDKFREFHLLIKPHQQYFSDRTIFL